MTQTLVFWGRGGRISPFGLQYVCLWSSLIDAAVSGTGRLVDLQKRAGIGEAHTRCALCCLYLHLIMEDVALGADDVFCSQTHLDSTTSD
jgi:hypothetical protein